LWNGFAFPSYFYDLNKLGYFKISTCIKSNPFPKNAKMEELIIHNKRINDIINGTFPNKYMVIGFYNDKLEATHYVETVKKI
jgi:hypothetical protein